MGWRNFRAEEQYRGWSIIVKRPDEDRYEYTLTYESLKFAGHVACSSLEDCLRRAKDEIETRIKYVESHSSYRFCT